MQQIQIPQIENYSRTGKNISGRADKKTKTGVLHLYDGIGTYDGITARDFAGALKSLGDVDYIELHINSPGGSVFDGAAIYNMLVDHQALIDVRIDGLAASIASVIALAGDQITIAKNAMMMLHNPSAIAFGDAAEMRKMADVLDKVKHTLVSVYSDRMGLPADEISQILDEESWYTANEAVDAGLADVVGGRAKIRKTSTAEARWVDSPPPWVPDDVARQFAAERDEETDNEVDDKVELEVESEQNENINANIIQGRSKYIDRLETLAKLEGV